jgi:hypothetical protein
VETIHDLNGLRKQFLRQIPDPGRSFADYYQTLSVPAAPTGRFPFHALGKLGKLAIGVPTGGAFDGR